MISGIGQLNWSSGTTAMPARPSPAEMFTKMDSNGDGSIDKAEFTAFGKQMAAKMGKADKSAEIFAKIDTNGEISQAENEAFASQMQAMRSKGGPPPGGTKSLDEMFAKMDTNGDGSVDKTEFEAFIQQMANQADSQASSTNKSNDLFSQIDTDGDGKISKSESTTFAAKMESQMQSMLVNSMSTLLNSQQSGATDTSSLYDTISQRYAQPVSTNAQSTVNLLG
jgi:Ca2+-binding EF-hand superfamily protein